MCSGWYLNKKGNYAKQPITSYVHISPCEAVNINKTSCCISFSFGTLIVAVKEVN